jgi:carbonic anhydrase
MLKAFSLAAIFLAFLPHEIAEESNHLDQSADSAVVIQPEQALARLLEGNRRFTAGQSIHPHESPNWRALLEGDQHPFAVILGCSDSRVPPELVFDQGFGDLFVVRVAGNVADTDVAASIEYAIHHCGTRLIVVMGHTGCGAVAACLDHLSNPDGEASEVIALLDKIEPAVIGIDDGLQREQVLSQAVERNVALAVRRLGRIPDLRNKIRTGQVLLAGMVYNMKTGAVRLLPIESVDSIDAHGFVRESSIPKGHFIHSASRRDSE